jgi:hypothetical protein
MPSTRQQKILDSVKPFRIIGQCFAFLPFSFENKFRNFNCVFSTLHTVFLVANSFLQWTYAQKVEEQGSNLSAAMVFAVSLLSNFIAALVAMTGSIHFGRIHEIFGNICRIDEKVRK